MNLLKPAKLLPLTLIALTMIASACGNKPTETAGGTATPKAAPQRRLLLLLLHLRPPQLRSNGAKLQT